MADETISAQNSSDLRAEVEKSRESAARLMENLAQKLGGGSAVRSAASGIGRAAQYVQDLGARDLAAGIEQAVRRRPGIAIAVAVAAGFLVGRAIRSR